MLLTDQAARKNLSVLAKELGSCGIYAASGALMDMWTAYEKEHPSTKLQPFNMLSKQRKFTRLVITVDWAVNQIAGFTPEKPEDIPGHAQMIQSKLFSKGVGTPAGVPCPKFLSQVLESMKSHKQVAESPSASAAPAPPSDRNPGG